MPLFWPERFSQRILLPRFYEVFADFITIAFNFLFTYYNLVLVHFIIEIEPDF
jgi:hypothetical protein